MFKRCYGLLLLLCLLLGIQNGFSKEVKRNSLWCFTFANTSINDEKGRSVDFNVKYLDKKSNKWKSVQKEQKGWGYQPEFSLDRCCQFLAPADLKAFEISMYINQNKYSLLVDQLPDSISNHKLIGFKNLTMKEKVTQYSYSELKGVVVSKYFNDEMIHYTQMVNTPKVVSNNNSYGINSSIKIYIEANDTTQSIILYGCGTPGTLYIVQQWINGSWVEYKNNWGIKCAQEKFAVKQYIIGLTIEKKGIYRVVFDKPSEMKSLDYPIKSNPFRIIEE